MSEPIRFAFHWRRPRLTAYRAADPRRFSLRLNRYPGVVIGAAIQVGRRVLSLTWGAPGRQVSGCVDCARGVFHNVHTSPAERDAKVARLAAALKAAAPVTPSSEEQPASGTEPTRED